jgi:predicted AlkP superfamily pyrophosphatase or phosphodiesterase
LYYPIDVKMKKITPLLFVFLCFPTLLSTHLTAQSSSTQDAPKLLVGIIVDQMRYDYLTRFYNDFGEGGFKRLLNEGFHFKNNHYNYLPTDTAPGHASIFTGTPPAVHGIIGNSWFDKIQNKKVYCASDDTVQPVGTTSSAGKMSPSRLLTTTITDELKIATQRRAKVIGIALKDRSAIFPAGHAADAAYWFRGKDEGNWISSTYYMNELPQWVRDFNGLRNVESYMNQVWDTYYDINRYSQSDVDDAPYELLFQGTEQSVFPYDLAQLRKQNDNYDLIRYTPFGNNLTTDFAIAALEGEQLGQDSITDFITISYSSPDYIGHHFGSHSKEVHDNYIRLDKEIERLLNFLDQYIGVNQYTLFLTSDHGVLHTPGFLQKSKIPSGFFDYQKLTDFLNEKLMKTYGTPHLIANISKDQIFLNHQQLQTLELPSQQVENTLASFLLEYPLIEQVFTRNQLFYRNFEKGMGYLIQNGFHQKRSGDILFTLAPGYISTWYQPGGTAHGSGYTYDTHVPLLFFGQGIKPGFTYQKSEIIDIAPTVSALMGISFPSGCTGSVLTELFE